tara:strand:+ start:462 stop:806 length:345 start_codon:yes stop_codon:yes gene_type:complete
MQMQIQHTLARSLTARYVEGRQRHHIVEFSSHSLTAVLGRGVAHLDGRQMIATVAVAQVIEGWTEPRRGLSERHVVRESVHKVEQGRHDFQATLFVRVGVLHFPSSMKKNPSKH